MGRRSSCYWHPRGFRRNDLWWRPPESSKLIISPYFLLVMDSGPLLPNDDPMSPLHLSRLDVVTRAFQEDGGLPQTRVHCSGFLQCLQEAGWEMLTAGSWSGVSWEGRQAGCPRLSTPPHLSNRPGRGLAPGLRLSQFTHDWGPWRSTRSTTLCTSPTEPQTNWTRWLLPPRPPE